MGRIYTEALILIALINAVWLALVPHIPFWPTDVSSKEDWLLVVGWWLIHIIVIRHYYSQVRLIRFLRTAAQTHTTTTKPPRGFGSFREVVRSVHQLNQTWAESITQVRTIAAALEYTIEHIPDPLIMLDQERRIIRANEAARRFFGENILYREFTVVIRDPWVIEAANSVIRGELSRQHELLTRLDADKDFRVRIEPLMSHFADQARLIMTWHDVTALRQAEKTMADFIANASHELKTPLSVIIGFVETLQGPAKDDAKSRSRFLSIMLEEAQRMKRLVNDLLSLSRLEQKRFDVPNTTVNIDDCLTRVIDTLTLQIAAKDVSIQRLIPPHLPHVQGDPDELKQVLQNLIENAIKYGKMNGQIIIQAETTLSVPANFPNWAGEVVCVRIMDDGPGIPREYIPRLTERFFRVEKGKSAGSDGTGLGLAIVKRIINRHRGALSIESDESKGSTFSVYLRAALKEEASLAPTPDDQA